MANERNENAAEPIGVRCYDDCYWIREDFGDRYTPPSSECGKDYKAFEDLNIDPCYSERSETECPDCPFYINYDTIVQMDSEYHSGEPFTQRDSLSSKSDEELAEWIARQTTDGGKKVKESEKQFWLDWLKTPVGGGEEDA